MKTALIFDHADIYGNGECEEIFADALAKTSIKREDLLFKQNVESFQV